ncbi:reticulon-4-interacting protein 1, mitochondrial-like isoform X1 [Plodia interpunctella]|uniref:reticulon-4-interacting protein 1, mitochondrial-like isoform X1 n=2 Tax=Plodia interpunctella TaxID=58824 RepID=UPI0023684AC9|nr:reticulon-4-interacting protein 1, mitochondrial-like isoform X1 [Plodia interpunctella]
MDDLKHRAGEKLEAFHIAAKTAANGGKSRVQDAFNQTSDALARFREIFRELWQNELIVEGRERIAAWTRDAVQRIREGAPPLSPILLYEELVALFKDRVWRRSVIIFVMGAVIGGSAGLCIGLRAAAREPHGPHARALHSQPDHSVLLVEDAVAPSAGAGEVLVRVQAFSVCAVDRCVLRGRGAALRGLICRGPTTLGRGFAGVVLDVGPGVTSFELGDEVWGCVSEWAGGAAAELLTIRSSRISKRPRSVAADSAAALPWSGSAALAALDALRLTPHDAKGKRVAISGASSGEGCALVQLLAGWGARASVLAKHCAANELHQLGAHELIEPENSTTYECPWTLLQQHAARCGPWDAALLCNGPPFTHNTPPPAATILKATAPRNSVIDLRPKPLITDRLPTPLAFVFGVSFYTFRLLRWVVGLGTHTDWLEDKYKLSEGLDTLAQLVDSGVVAPVLDKVYLPQDYESALAHACSDEALGTTVVRFP